MIKSHIVLPKFLLKSFEIDHSFWYYDIDKDFIAKGNASSFNTEKGYYSDETEQILNREIETPFSNLLNNYRPSVLAEDEFEMSLNDILCIKRFCYSLLCRNPQMVEKVKDKSVFYQFLTESDQHGSAAIMGIKEGERIGIFDEYDASFFINRTVIPFVLPNCGLYSLRLKEHPAIVLPVSSDVMFALGKNMRKENEESVELQRGLITEESVIKRMNMQALMQQIDINGGGRIVCSRKEELNRLRAEYHSQQEHGA